MPDTCPRCGEPRSDAAPGGLCPRCLMGNALDHGAVGFIPKSSSVKVMLSALNLVFSGGIYVPPSALHAEPAPAPEPEPVERSGGAELHAQTLRRGPYYFAAPTGPSRAIVRV